MMSDEYEYTLLLITHTYALITLSTRAGTQRGLRVRVARRGIDAAQVEGQATRASEVGEAVEVGDDVRPGSRRLDEPDDVGSAAGPDRARDIISCRRAWSAGHDQSYNSFVFSMRGRVRQRLDHFVVTWAAALGVWGFPPSRHANNSRCMFFVCRVTSSRRRPSAQTQAPHQLVLVP